MAEARNRRWRARNIAAATHIAAVTAMAKYAEGAGWTPRRATTSRSRSTAVATAAMITGMREP